MTASLSDTFEPPSTTAYGRSVELVSCSKHFDLGGHQLARVVRQQRARRRRPRPACGAPRRNRRTRKPPSSRPARPAAWPARSRSASSLLVSRGSKRMFSSSRTSPSVSPSARASASDRRRHPPAARVGPAARRQRLRDGRERELRVGSALGPAQVRGDDDLGAGVGQRLQRRHRRDDAARVGDVAVVVERDVQVRAHQHAAAPKPFCQ